MKLRPYQEEALEAVADEFKRGNSTLVVLPTGCGKTVVFAEAIRRMQPRRAMMVAHREELITQAQDKIAKVTGLKAEIEMAQFHAGGFFGKPAPVIVSSVQTQCSGGDGLGRMANFDPQDFGLLVIDEAHHATASTYRRVINWYGKNPDLKVLGVTATPDRADEAALGSVFGSVAYNYEIADAIKDGWLVPIMQQMITVEGLDYSGVRTTAGDLNGADLSRILEEEENLQRIAAPSAEIIGNKRAVAFCASVKEAERLAEIFERYGKRAAAVSGTTDKELRRRTLADFAAGQIQVICNCGVLTEGFDDSGVEVIIMARPTKSRALYAQMVGRGTRPAETIAGKLGTVETGDGRRQMIADSQKPGCLVIDFVGNAGKHKLMTTADILGGKYPEDVVEMAGARAKAAQKPVDMEELLADAAREKEEKARLAAAARRALKGTAKYRVSSVDPFSVYGITRAPTVHGWDRHRHLTDKQTAALAKAIRKTPEQIANMPYAQAKQLFDQVAYGWKRGLASFAQMQLLIKNGLATPGMPITYENASAMISRLAARQGWGRR